MRFVFKINSGFDGFRPALIPDRLEPDGRLSLGWAKYIEVAERGEEVWVYFRGPHRFVDGVYVKGTIDEVDLAGSRVLLRVRDVATDAPLTDAATGERIAELVSRRYQQVFVVPEHVAPVAGCTLATTADSCRGRSCGFCPVWQHLPRVDPQVLGHPRRLPRDVLAYVPAYWVLPPRNVLYRSGRRVRSEIRRTSETFSRFKAGEGDLAYPLALGMYESLRERELTEFDCIVPIPLSPDKQANQEIHRTRLLARELAQLLGTDVLELLSLDRPISKRKLRGQLGYTARQFEAAYSAALVVDENAELLDRVLVVDDVCTEGSTVRATTRRLRQMSADCEIVIATAGQMTVSAAIRDATSLLA